MPIKILFMVAVSLAPIDDYVSVSTQLSLSHSPVVPDPAYKAAPGDKAVACGWSGRANTIYSPTGTLTAEDYDEYWRCAAAKDADGLLAITRRHRSAMITRGTELLVLEVEPFDAEKERAKDAVRPAAVVVRVMGGPLTGVKLWFSRSAVNRMLPNPYYKPGPKPADWAVRTLATAKGLEAAGKTAAAVTTYKRVVADTPGTPEATKAAARLKVLVP